jgi:hypothetical protein
MTTTLNATTSNGLVVTPDNSGNIQLQYNGVAAPTFSAYVGSSQNVSATTVAKVQYNTELWDTSNAYDSTTNYRFTPLVAGYYQVNGCIGWTSVPNGESWLSIYKNGSEYKRGFNSANGAVTAPFGTNVSGLVYMNGTTDYIELYTYNGAGSTRTIGNYTNVCFFDACLLRGA